MLKKACKRLSHTHVVCCPHMGCLAFGAGTQGQLGNGALEDTLSPNNVLLPSGYSTVDVVCGGNHAVCSTVDPSGHQQLFVWGVNHLSPRQQASSAAQYGHHSTAAEPHQQAAEQDSSSAAEFEAAGLWPDIVEVNTGPAVCVVPVRVSLPVPGARVVCLATGWGHTLMCTDAGHVWVAGDNSFGQLGLGQQLPTTGSGLVQLQLYQHLQQELSAANQGAVQHAQAQATAEPNQALQHWVAVDAAAGMHHSLVFLQHRAETSCQHQQCDSWQHKTAVVGFGSNKHHQLGHIHEPESVTCSSTSKQHMPYGAGLTAGGRTRSRLLWSPQMLGGLTDAGVTRLAAGGDRSACITRQGQLLLWGRALPGPTTNIADATSGGVQRNMGDSQLHYRMMPQPPEVVNSLVPSGHTAAAGQQRGWQDICLGWRHMLALDSAGRVWTAGDNSLGQLGTPSNVQSPQPVVQSDPGPQSSSSELHCVLLPAAVVSIAAGAEHCAVVLQDGSVYTWGWSEHGQCGTGSTADAAGPQQVASAGWQAAGVACGSGFTVLWTTGIK